MTFPLVVALLAPPALLAIAAGVVLLRRAMGREKLLPEEIALAAAWVYVVGGLVWLGVFLGGSTLLGFGAPWTWLAAAHFVFAGFGALTITAFSCRVVSDARASRILRTLLIAHPVAYLVTAAGISGIRYCDESGAAIYFIIFTAQLTAVSCGRPNRMKRGPRFLFLIALAAPVCTMVPALAWAWGVPILDLFGMVRYHGLVNAVGHVGLGLVAIAWGGPASHSALRERAFDRSKPAVP